MEKCRNCGIENEASATTCRGCGNELPTTNERQETQAESKDFSSSKESSSKSNSALGSKFSKKLLIPVTSVVVLLIAIGIYMGVASAGGNPMKVVEQFENAIVDGDSNAVMKLLEPGDPLLKIDEAAAQQLITYYKENPSAFSDEMEQLKFDAEMWNDSTSIVSTSFAKVDEDVDEILTFVKRSEDQGFLSSKYAIRIKPLYFKVITNQKGTKFHLNDKEILTAKVDYYDKVLGPYMPGTYEMKAAYSGEYVSLSTDKEVKLPADHDKEIDLTLQAEYIFPESNDPEARLYVNGKDTAKTFANMERFGPVATDGSMTVHAQKETEWGMLYSDKVKITDENIYPSLPLNGIYIYPDSNFPSAKLLINDKNTGISIGDAYYDGFGPLPYDSALTMQAEKIFPWGTYKSEKKPVKEDASWEELNLSIDALDEKVEEQLVADTNSFLKTLIESYDKSDASGLKNATADLKTNIQDIVADSTYQGYIIDAVYDLDSFSLTQRESGDYVINFVVQFTTNETNYDYASNYDYTWEIDAIYDEATSKWHVSEYSGTYYYGGENTKEFTF